VKLKWEIAYCLLILLYVLGFVTWAICPKPIFGYHGPACLCSECISIGEDERDYRHGGDR
jgi:hypothetical protein